MFGRDDYRTRSKEKEEEKRWEDNIKSHTGIDFAS